MKTVSIITLFAALILLGGCSGLLGVPIVPII